MGKKLNQPPPLPEGATPVSEYAAQDPDAIVIQSHGMGVESQAILERWEAEPETRPFKDWSQLIVITSQVGEEHKVDTIRDCEARMLPLLRKHNVRFVELARRGHLEADGIVVLQDTRQPHKMNPEGVYKLSDELLHSGTVPQFGGEHRCAMKFKAFVIETWLAWEFRDKDDIPVYHVFGYNDEERTRIAKSDHHIARHNGERLVDVKNRPPLEIFGFNDEERVRVYRSKLYDGPNRTGCYPLLDWGWGRQKCEDYIFQQTGIRWKKSHCSFCPFCKESTKAEPGAIARWYSAPEQTAHGLVVEYNSLCFNFRGQLFRNNALIDVIRENDVKPVIEAFERELSNMDWGLYRVRRIYSKKGSAIRCVEPVKKGTRQAMDMLFDQLVESMGYNEGGPKLDYQVEVCAEWRGIRYAFFAEREPDVYPTREGFYVVAPDRVPLKLRGPLEKFNERWDRVGRGLPMNPEKKPKRKRTAKV